MKPLVFVLTFTLMAMQYKLWIGEGSVPHVYALKQELLQQQAHNSQLLTRNQAIEAEITELKSGEQTLEEIARNELGMVARGETFYQLIE